MNAFRGDSALSDIELEEKFSSRSLDQGVSARLLPLVAPVWRPIAAVIGIEIAQVLAIFARPLLIGLVIDRGLRQTGVDAGLIAWACVGLAATWGIRFTLGGLSQYCAGIAAIRVLNDLRARVFAHVQTLSVGQVHVAGMVATYFGQQRLTHNHQGAEVYGGSDLTVVRGDFQALLSLALAPEVRTAVEQALLE